LKIPFGEKTNNMFLIFYFKFGRIRFNCGSK